MGKFSELEIKNRILKILTDRQIGKTMCPSEALPSSSRKNKALMEIVRKVALKMAKNKTIEIVQKGQIVDLKNWKGPIRLRFPLSKVPFEYKGIDFSKRPELYRIARGEQGVLSVEPYKSELLPLWRFKDISAATKSSKALYRKFLSYRKARDFVGMDMTRKFLQMGVTRSRRYANHRSGQKYIGPVPLNMKGRSGAHGRKLAPPEPDLNKAKCAEIFAERLAKVNADPLYLKLKIEWKKVYG